MKFKFWYYYSYLANSTNALHWGGRTLPAPGRLLNAMRENQIPRMAKDPDDEEKWKGCIVDQILGAAINEQQKGFQH
jgi:hypothetical protein